MTKKEQESERTETGIVVAGMLTAWVGVGYQVGGLFLLTFPYFDLESLLIWIAGLTAICLIPLCGARALGAIAPSRGRDNLSTTVAIAAMAVLGAEIAAAISDDGFMTSFQRTALVILAVGVVSVAWARARSDAFARLS